MIKKVMMSGLISALVVVNAFSSAPASSSSSRKILGSFAFADRDDAKRHGVLFDKNNKFVVGQKVVVDEIVPADEQRESRFLVYGIITGQSGQYWFVDADFKGIPGKTYYDVRRGYLAERLGKIPKVAARKVAASSSSSCAPEKPAFSSAPASSSSSGLSVSNFAFKNVVEAKRHGVSFDKNNNFVVGEKIVVDDRGGSSFLVYGIITRQDGKYWVVDARSKGKNYFDTLHYYLAEHMGKIPKVAASKSAASSSSSCASGKQAFSGVPVLSSHSSVRYHPHPQDSIIEFTKDELGAALNNILGGKAFKNKDQAEQHYISFDKNNTFSRRELVVVPKKISEGANSSQLYGIVLGSSLNEPGIWNVQIATRNEFMGEESFVSVPTADIGKMLLKSYSFNKDRGGDAVRQAVPMQAAASSSSEPAQSQAASMVPGGPSIELEPGEEEEEGKEQVEGRPNQAEVQIEGLPSMKK